MSIAEEKSAVDRSKSPRTLLAEIEHIYFLFDCLERKQDDGEVSDQMAKAVYHRWLESMTKDRDHYVELLFKEQSHPDYPMFRALRMMFHESHLNQLSKQELVRKMQEIQDEDGSEHNALWTWLRNNFGSDWKWQLSDNEKDDLLTLEDCLMWFAALEDCNVRNSVKELEHLTAELVRRDSLKS